MSLRRRSVAVVVGIALILAIISYVPGMFILRNNIDNLVDDQKRLFLERINHIIENDVRALQVIAEDWGAWDETYAFAEDLNPAYIRDNLEAASLSNLGLSFIVFLDPEGRAVHSVNMGDGLGTTDVDSVTLDQLVGLSGLITERSWGGLAIVNGSPAVVAAEKILTSHYMGPARGTLLMARVLSEADLARYSAITQGRVRIFYDSLSSVPQVEPVVDGHVQATGSIIALDGRALAVSISFVSGAAVLGQRVIWHLALLLSAVTVAFVLVSSLMLKRYVVNPVTNLTDYVQKVAAATQIGSYEPDASNEIKATEGLVRDVFDKLQDYQLLYTTMCEGVAIRELITDEQGIPIDYRYIDVNPSYEQMSGMRKADIVGKTYREIRGTMEADWPQEYTDVALTGVPRRFIRLYSNGRYYEILCYQTKPLQFVSVISDVTERVSAEEQSRANQRDLQNLVDTMGDMLFVLDTEGRVVHVNRAVESALGYCVDELVGASSEYFHPEDLAEDVKDNILDVLAGRTPSRSIALLTRDGRSIPVETRSTRGRWGGQDVIFAVVRDVSDRVKSEERLHYLSMHDQLTEVYNRAFFAAEMERLEGSREYPISIISADANGLKLINDVLGHRPGDDYLQDGAALLKEVLRKSDILARVGGDEFAIILPKTPLSAAEAVAERIRTRAAESRDDSSFLPMSFSLGVATSVGPAVSLDDTYKLADYLMYREKLTHKASSRDRIYGALLGLLKERDYSELGHTEQVEDLCLMLGRSLALSPEQMAGLGTLAHVHDFGAIALPAELVHKPSTLTAEEWELVRQHPEKGFRIAYAFPELVPIADLILRHHERWDGRGYPLGLSGAEIPIECRILAIADAYSAMTAGRPYQSAMPPQAALRELNRFAGVQFDPELVERFGSLVIAACGMEKSND